MKLPTESLFFLLISRMYKDLFQLQWAGCGTMFYLTDFIEGIYVTTGLASAGDVCRMVHGHPSLRYFSVPHHLAVTSRCNKQTNVQFTVHCYP